MQECILIAYSEVGLKGREGMQRKKFEEALAKNISAICGSRVRRVKGRIVVSPKNEDEMCIMLSKIRCVFGVSHYFRAWCFTFSSIDEITKNIAGLFGKTVSEKKFRVTARREGNHHFRSMDLQRSVGKALNDAGGKVDLEDYEINVNVEVRENKVYAYCERIEGPGGLPVGTMGKVIVLFSGGIDSPVAAWMAMKRGCVPDFLFINLGGNDAFERTYSVYREFVKMWCIGHRPRFFVADGRGIVDAITSCVKPSYRQVVLKRAFYSIASGMCKRTGMGGIVTGESLGQVSTQTLANLSAIETNEDVFFIRPLICLDKEDIIGIAKKIGTYGLSIKVGELCGISKGSVKTAASAGSVNWEFGKVSCAAEEALSSVREVDWENNAVVDKGCMTAKYLGEDRACGVDVTIVTNPPSSGGEKWVKIDIDKETLDAEKLDKNVNYYIMCKDGIKASVECDMLRKLGFKCVSSKKSLM